jgi:hypothetical protein
MGSQPIASNVRCSSASECDPLLDLSCLENRVNRIAHAFPDDSMSCSVLCEQCLVVPTGCDTRRTDNLYEVLHLLEFAGRKAHRLDM